MITGTSEYRIIHFWIEAQMGKPKLCQICQSITAKKYEWANKSKKYLKNTQDWIRLCTSCHRRYDVKPVCKRGHVRGVSQGSISVGELYGVKFKQELSKEIVWSSPGEVVDFITGLLAEQRKEIAEKIPNYFVEWRREVDKAYKDKKPTVLWSFPVWLEKKLDK